MRLRARRLAFGIAGAFVAITLAIPWVFYGYALSLVEGRPTKPSALPGHNEVRQVWITQEKSLKQEDLAGISPYWFYKWLWCAFDLTNCGRDGVYRNVSSMASFVAIWYLRDGHFKGRGMGPWHGGGIVIQFCPHCGKRLGRKTKSSARSEKTSGQTGRRLRLR
jgi:hypothetical protein